jgi:hypothetical protein
MSASLAVSASDRHSKSKPCPICDGHPQMDQGKGERCWGFEGDSPRVFCTRIDNNGAKSSSEDASIHFLDGRCQCGQPHADGSNQKPDAWRTKSMDWRGESPQRPKEDARVLVEDPPKPWVHPDKAIETAYHYTNEQGGEYIVEVVRFTDEYRENRNGIPKTLPRYRTDEGVFSGLPSAIGKTDGVHLYRQRDALEAIRMGYPLHIVEGEKDADRAKSAGLCATTNICGALAFKAWQAEMIAGAWREAGKDSDLFLILDRDVAGVKRGEKIAGRLIEAGIPADRIRAVQSATAGEGDDLSDHLDAGFGPNDLEPVDLEVLARSEMEEARDPSAERFDEANTSISFILDSDPPPREYLIPDFMPAHESGLIVAAGGTGKGHFQTALAIAMALGFDFGGYSIPKPRGVVLVSVEDDRHEMHRRMRAALDLAFRDKSLGWEDVRGALEKRIRIVDLRGTTGVRLGPDMREQILRVVDQVEDPGLITLDPMSRLLPDMRESGGLNSQEGAGIILNEADAIRTETGCTVLGAHHVAKDAIRNGGELKMTAATGSQQLVDLSRWVVNLKSLDGGEISQFGLPRGHYIEAAVTKTNYSPPMDAPMVFQRGDGGALSHVIVESRQAHDEDAALAILRSLGEWTSMKDWRDAGKNAENSLSKDRIDAARRVLLSDGLIQRVEIKTGRTRPAFYAPSDWHKAGWPDPPEGEK